VTFSPNLLTLAEFFYAFFLFHIVVSDKIKCLKKKELVDKREVVVILLYVNMDSSPPSLVESEVDIG
jgi:hypothetical protein